jgi:hypothetical protein
MNTVIRTVTYMKTCQLKSRHSAELCEKMREEYQSFLFTVILADSQEDAFCGLCSQLARTSSTVSRRNLVHVEHFRNEYFVSKLAYLSYIF